MVKTGRTSSRMFLYLISVIVLASVIDFSILKVAGIDTAGLIFIKELSTEFLNTFIGSAIGAISAVLGLIFALYAVGFQLVTDKYSSDVSDYINNAHYGNFFFKLLILTDLYLLYLLLEINIFQDFPGFSFFIAILLITLSIFGILTFKDSFLTGLKPKAIFSRLLEEAKGYINVATSRHKFFYRSISAVSYARDSLRVNLDRIGTVYEDLKRNKNWNDVVYAPLVFGQVLESYLVSKKYLDHDRGWWFYQKYKEVEADNSTTVVLKLNYELRGVGPLNTPTADTDWVEDKILSWFKQFNRDIDKSKERSNFTLQLIAAYQSILHGDYEKDTYGKYERVSVGAYGNQEFTTFNKYLDLFFQLFDSIDTTDSEVMDAYTNAYFAISQSVLDGNEYKHLEHLIDRMITPDSILGMTKDEVLDAKLPSRFYAVLNAYYSKLEVEQALEGRILTPKEFAKKEILSGLKSEENREFEKQLVRLADFQEKVAKTLYAQKSFDSLALLMRLRLEWFSRLFYLEKFDLAESHSGLIPKLGIYTLFIPKAILVKYNFQLQIEKIIFLALLKKKRSLSRALIKLLLLVLSVLNTDEDDPSFLVPRVKRARILVILGAYIYLLSEFEQNKEMLIYYVNKVEKLFAAGTFVQVIQALGDARGMGLSLQLALIESETSRYHHWFGLVHQEIDQLPKTYDEVRFYAGMQEVADHPSKFIREISHDLAFLEDTIIEAFVDWVKKREAIKDFIRVLKNK